MWLLRPFISLIFTQAAMGRLPSIMCYTCTTIDADRLLVNLYDATWRRWLQNVRFVPKTQQCDDFFVPELALQSGTRSHACDDGVCMKMWFKEISGNSHVWRGCVPNAQQHVRSDCTRISSSQVHHFGGSLIAHYLSNKSSSNVYCPFRVPSSAPVYAHLAPLMQQTVPFYLLIPLPMSAGGNTLRTNHLGEMELCTCDNNLCNMARRVTAFSTLLPLAASFSFLF